MADYLAPAKLRATMYGYRLVLRTAHPGAPRGVIGWTDHDERECYVYTDRISQTIPPHLRQAVTLKVALHEVGHARWARREDDYLPTSFADYWRYVRGGTLGTDQQVEEDYCEVYSKHIAPQLGVGYSFRSPSPTARWSTIVGAL